MLVSSDVGQELSDEVTQRVVVGGPASRYFIARISDCIPIWGKLGPKKYLLAPNFLNAPSAYLPDAKVIITERNQISVIESCMNHYGWIEQNAKRFVERRTNAMRYLYRQGYPVINFDEELDDEYIETFLRENLYA